MSLYDTIDELGLDEEKRDKLVKAINEDDDKRELMERLNRIEERLNKIEKQMDKEDDNDDTRCILAGIGGSIL